MRRRGQRGRSQATLDLIDTCLEIIESAAPITVRGICYRLFAAGAIDSMALKNTKRVSRVLTHAREEGHIPWEAIVDTKREEVTWAQWSNLEAYAESVAEGFAREFWSDQPFVLKVVSEKATVGGLLEPVLNRYGVHFFPVSGFNSATKVHDLADGIAGDPRKTVLLYLGDFDPSGMCMSVRDLPGRLRRYGASDFTFLRIALTEEDTASLPHFDAHTKKKDPRYKWYVREYGTKAWELDAMDPQTLRARVASYIRAYVDDEAWERHERIEEAQRRTTRMIAAQLAEAKDGPEHGD